MNYNNQDYSIIQTSDASWAIQYRNGPQIGKFASSALAAEQAQHNATTASNNPTQLEHRPLDLTQASVLAEQARNNYRAIAASNPNDSDQLQAQLDLIHIADAYVSDFLIQQQAARDTSGGTRSYEELNQDQRIATADALRTQRAQEAVAARSNGSSNEQIAQADQLAFDSEIHYNNVVSTNAIETLTPTSFLSNITGAASGGLSFLTNSFENLGNTALGGLQQGVGAFTSGLGSLFGGNSNRSTTGSATPIELPNSSLNPNFSGGNAFGTTGGSAAGDTRIRISPKPSLRGKILTGLMQPLAETGGMLFPYTPNIQYMGEVNYQTLATVHSNQDWRIYSGTPSISLNIDGTFTAQNKKEAEYYLACIHFLRVMSKMHFGESEDNKGLPPPQVLLDGYGTHMFNSLSVIVTNFSIGLPNNVDYVDVNLAGGTASIPVMSNITVNLVVQQTPAKAMTFNWDKFASGELMQQKGWL